MAEAEAALRGRAHDNKCDVLVIGSGSAGLAAAITARRKGLDVLVIDKEPYIGGTSAVSGGWLWIPGNPVAAREGVVDDLEGARRYIEHQAGNSFDPECVQIFLDNGPRMVAFFEQQTQVKFIASPEFPDYHAEASGGSKGRSILTQPYDGRALGARLKELRPPLREATFVGMNLGSGSELVHFLNARRSLRSAAYVVRRVATHTYDTLRYGRGMRLSNGNALMGRLARSAFDLDIPIWLSAPARALEGGHGRVTGATVERDGPIRVEARRGVVLATGGFSHNQALLSRLFPPALQHQPHLSPTPKANTGDGLFLGEAAGGYVVDTLRQPAAWVPTSMVRHRDGSTGAFPHVIDRAKPGVIAVTRRGERFVNEALAYHDFVQAMIAACDRAPAVEAFLICDHRTLRRYGLGHVKPFPVPLRWHLRSGYLQRGQTLQHLATQLGIDADALATTVKLFNGHAREGADPQFGKGTTAYNQFQGDAAHAPNPCVAPLEHPPFYAVRVVPGDLSTFAGLKTDGFGRVVDASRRPVPGLYAAGAAAASIMGGSYPAAGINLGPAMTFGYVIGCHLAGEAP
jgi:succinate dehydrogenase/fumarate reductase flavoprotein subunit